MNGFIIFFLAGMTLVYHSPILPTLSFLCCLITLALTLVSKRFWLPAGFIFGLVWAGFNGQQIVDSALPDRLHGIDLQIIGRISGLPRIHGHVTRFEFEIDEVVGEEHRIAGMRNLRLSWYSDAPELAAGDRWQFTVRLKKNRGLMNPGGFDYEKWLLGNQIDATGYVRAGENSRLISTSDARIDEQLRTYLIQKIQSADIPEAIKSLSRALAAGDGGAVSTRQWEWFRLTGTSHLLVISGLHISLVAAAVWWLAGFVRKASSRFQRNPPDHEMFNAVASMVAAIAYAALAGFSVPTLRALIMLGVYLMFRINRRHLSLPRPLLIALFLVLMIQPLSPLSPGFWLSFLAVALIYYLAIRIHNSDIRIRKWLLWHALLTLAMLPLSALFFNYLSPLTFVANLFAVPLLSLVLVPMVLIGAGILLVSERLGSMILGLANYPAEWLLDFLQRLASVDSVQFWLPVHSGWQYVMLMFAMAVFLLPRGTGLNWLGIPLASVFLFPNHQQTESGTFHLSVIDVGQGLSALVETKNHNLLFDTGGRFSKNGSIADSTIIPFLRSRGISNLDALIISHPDSDHAGGVMSLSDHFKIGKRVTAAPFREQLDADESCDLKSQWEWDGVRFEFLNDSQQLFRTKNDNSCVLRVESGKSSVLLPGDIELSAENSLLDKGIEPVSLVVASHHGSKTSSGWAFLKALQPEYVVYTVGYKNRYSFPHDSVQQRYAQLGSKAFRSDRDGLLQFSFNPDGLSGQPQIYRNAHTEFWRSNFDLGLE